MRYPTLQEVRERVELELDLQEETFITPEELNGYIREGINIAETEIMGLYEDYFLTSTDWLTIASENAMPSDIYANKLRKVEVTNDKKFIEQVHKNVHLRNYDTGYYAYNTKYQIYNKTASNPVLAFENADDFTMYRLHYIRNANRPLFATDLIDLPEFAIEFVKHFARCKCYEKEMNPLTSQAKGELEGYRRSMIESLSSIVDDGTDLMEMDLSFYQDSSIDDCYYY